MSIGLLLAGTMSAVGADSPQPQPMAVVARMIEQAGEGAVVRVPSGAYQGNLIIRKPIVLEADGAVIFDGDGTGTVVEVAAEGVTIRGMTVRGTGNDVTTESAAIRVLAGHATIESNVVEDALFGIDLREAPDSTVRNNTIACKDLEPGRRGDGIRLWWSHGCTVEGNTVRGSRDMVFWYSEDLHIAHNRVTASRYGLHFMYSHHTVLEGNELEGNSVGIYLMYSNAITLRGNRMSNNRGASGYGIGLKDCDDIVVESNTIVANRVGIYVDNSPSSVDSTGLIRANTIAYNEVGLLATPNTHGNVFTRNGFRENETGVATLGRGELTSNAFAQDGVGNYWSDYAGFDLDADGVGDVAYEPRSLFNSMLAHEPNLRLFVHSPAQQAIEFMARALPELRPMPTLADPSPLVTPPDAGFVGEGSRSGTSMGLLAAGLAALAAACMALLGTERQLPRLKSGTQA